MSMPGHFLLFSMAGALFFAADQLAKLWVINASPSFGGAFGIVAHLNTGFAWGIPIGNSIALVVMLVVAALLALLLAGGYGYRYPALWIILGGAASNILDRAFRGGVVDYLAIPWGGIVNIADIAIIAGILLIVFSRGNEKPVQF